MRSEGCLGVLKSVRDNPVSALELLDFSVRTFHSPLSFPTALRSTYGEEESKA